MTSAARHEAALGSAPPTALMTTIDNAALARSMAFRIWDPPCSEIVRDVPGRQAPEFSIQRLQSDPARRDLEPGPDVRHVVTEMERAPDAVILPFLARLRTRRQELAHAL